VQKLSIISCKLKSLENFPELPALERIELSDNKISGTLEVLAQYPELKVIKLAGNKIKSLEDIVCLKNVSKLENLDLAENPLCKQKDYPEKVWELLPELKVLDGVDRDGEEVISLGDDEGDEEEENEGEEGDNEFIDDQKLTEEEKKKLENEGIKFLEGEGEYAEGDEEAEGEADEEEDAKAGDKRAREDEEAEGNNKRQKTDE
jgi:Leucine-rich repeat (LRR) protein